MMKKDITIQEKYEPAMAIKTQKEADDYLDTCIKHSMRLTDKTYEECAIIERTNLGYYAGYHDHETRQRVEKLFKCWHPMLGPAGEKPMDPKEAMLRGSLKAQGLL